MMTFQKFLNKLSAFWEEQGCIIHQGYDLEVGAGTFNPATFLRCLGPEPYRAAYIEPCRRPADGRYGENPNRLQHYFQYQVILKPSPLNIQELYLKSLEALGFDLQAHDIRFVHDDWESPTLGAWGLGWEVWMDGMEITQFTYFQSVGGVELHPVTGEITYGIERLAMYLQKVDSIFELQWNDHLFYGDIYQQNEIEWSHYNFEKASTSMWQRHFEDYEQEAKRLIEDKFPIPAYDFVMKASHAFNLLDARGAISVTERTGYIARIRDLARQIAKAYIASREEQGFPLLSTSYSDATDHEPAKQLQLPQSFFDTDPGSTDDFLLEIGSEDLPAAFIPIGIAYFDREIRSLLDKEEIPYESIEVYATPRRLGILIRNLSKGKPPKSTEKKGPSLEQAYDSSGNPKPPGEGFFRSLGISPPPVEALREGKVPQAEIRSIKETPYLFGTMHQKGRPTAEILIEQIPSLVLNADFPKTMRWGEGNISYARPLRWIVALFGEEIVPIRIGGLEADRLTYGHRQLSPQAIPLHQPQDYLQELTRHFVQADQLKREKNILDQLDRLEAELKAQIIERDRVMPQVVNLTEWPQCTAASFKPEFLRAPKEVLISEMVEHQKYFPVCGQDGSLKNLFIITANIPPTDQIREGNQRVLSSRLSDGVFLYEEDLKIPLEAFNEKLKKVTYQKELGTVFQKLERIVAHAEIIQKDLGISSFEKVTRAAKLCKADLASNMVYEFPELQGIVGSYYALAHGEEEEIAKAINEHWMPRGEHAPLPETETGVVVSLADKFDNLLGSFAIGMKPTSSSDPYALRRQVLGIIKMLIKGKYELSLKECLLGCSSNFSPAVMPRKQETVNEILEFIANRVKTVFLDYGFLKDEIEASLAHGCKDIYDIFCRVNALHAFREQARDRFISLFEVFKRAKGQLNGQLAAQVLPEVLIEPAEKELNALLDSRQTAFKQALDQRNYNEAYTLLAAIQPALAELFDKVKILADDPKIRENRLGLLKRVFNLFDELLDFSKIQEK